MKKILAIKDQRSDVRGKR